MFLEFVLNILFNRTKQVRILTYLTSELKCIKIQVIYKLNVCYN